MLELIFQGFIEWVYSLVLECWNFFSASLLDIMSLDLAYIRSHVPIIGDIMQVLLAVGWALLLGNMVFQALKGMAAGLGFEAEDPKMLFGRSAVFSFLLLASPQICEIALNMTSRIITLLDLPNAIDVHLVDAGIFGNLLAGWLVVIVCNIVIMCRVLKLLLKIAEQYVILSTLTIAAPLAFSMGGSKSTSAIFTGWCRMYGSMCLLMVSNVIFFKMLLSVMSAIPSGLDVFPWMVLIFSIVKVAKRMDDTITRIGLNPAQTGAQGGRSFPGMLAATVMHGAVSQVTKTIGGAVGGTVGGVLGGAGRGAAAAGRTFAGGAAAGLGAAARRGGGRNTAPRTDSRQAYTQQNSTQQTSSQQNQASTANTQQSAFQQNQAGTGAPQRPAGGQNQPGTGSPRQPASRPNPSGAANTQQAGSRQNQPPAAGTQQYTFQQFPASQGGTAQPGGANTSSFPISAAGRNGGRAFRYSRNTSVPHGMRRSPSYIRDTDGPPSGRAGTGADFRAGGSRQDTPEGRAYRGRAGGRSTGGVPRSGVGAPHSGSFGGGSRGGFRARRAGAVSETTSYEHSASSVTERTASFGGANGERSIPGHSLRADSPAAGAAGRGRSPTARPAVDKMSGSAAGARSRNSAGTPAAPRSGTAGTGSPAAASGQQQEGPGSAYGGQAARSTKVTGRERSQRPAVSAGAAAAPPARPGRGQHTHSTESRSTHRRTAESNSVTTTATTRSASQPDMAGTPAKVRQPAQTPPGQVIPPAAGAQPPKRARSSPARQEARQTAVPARSPAQRDLSRPGTAGTAPEARRPAREAETAKRSRDRSMSKAQAPGIKRQPIPPASAGKKPQPKQPDRSGRGGGHE